MVMLRPIQAEDIPAVVDIHLSTWRPEELSVKLGADFIRLFYTQVVDSPHAFGFVSEQDGKPIAYAVGFSDYTAFNAGLKRRAFVRLGSIALRAWLGRRITIADLQNLIGDDQKLRNLRYPNYHLGALALAKDYQGTPTGKGAIGAAVGAVLDEFVRRGLPGCWGSCDADNILMRLSLSRFGFEPSARVDMMGKSIILFEKTFGLPSG
jgi:hypothetical protein